MFPTLRKHDPFDRMLIAQAKVEEMILLSSDGVLLGLRSALIVDSRK
jgi:PIN domain nuclease of toxin-antitoxin system